MHTLLMRLFGPQQSWGADSKFNIRATLRYPTRSGVIGIICAAMGIQRDQDISFLNNLKMGVRIDNPGTIEMEYQTAHNIFLANEKKDTTTKNRTEISYRYYLADAEFLVGLESEDLKLLQDIQNSLKKPKFHLFLGRKSYVPSKPIWLKEGIKKNTSLITALKEYPLLKRASKKNLDEILKTTESEKKENTTENIDKKGEESSSNLKNLENKDINKIPEEDVNKKISETCLLVIETDSSDAEETIYDMPFKNSYQNRKFLMRGIKIEQIEITNVKYTTLNDFI